MELTNSLEFLASMFKQESIDTPRFLTMSDDLTTELPSVISLMFNLDTCLGAPIIKIFVLLSFSLSVF